MDLNFEQVSLNCKRKSSSILDLKKTSLCYHVSIDKKRSSLCALEHLNTENDILFQSLTKKSFLNNNQEYEALNWKLMANDSKSILNELNKTDYEYEMDLENNNYEFKLNNYELCYDSSDFLEVKKLSFVLFTFRMFIKIKRNFENIMND